MKKILGLSLVAAMALSSSVFAADSEEGRTCLTSGLDLDVSASATITSDVLFRGGTLSNDQASGIANLSIAKDGVHLDSFFYDETDFTVGYANEVSDFSYDVGINNFNYKTGSKPDVEAYIITGYSINDFSLGVNYFHGFVGVTTKMLEVTAGYSIKDIADIGVIAGKTFNDTAYNSYVSASISRPCLLLPKGDIALTTQYTPHKGNNVNPDPFKFSISYTASF